MNCCRCGSGPHGTRPFTGVTLYLSDAAVDEAEALPSRHRGGRLRSTPPAESGCRVPYTRLPFQRQVALLRQLSTLSIPILMTAGHTDANVGVRLRDAIPVRRRGGVHIIPSTMTLDGSSALVDSTDALVSATPGRSTRGGPQALDLRIQDVPQPDGRLRRLWRDSGQDVGI